MYEQVVSGGVALENAAVLGLGIRSESAWNILIHLFCHLTCVTAKDSKDLWSHQAIALLQSVFADVTAWRTIRDQEATTALL